MTSSTFQVIFMILSCTFLKTEPTSLREPADPWTPADQQTLDEWTRCHGMDCRQWERTVDKLHKLSPQESPENPASESDNALFDDILFSEKQLDALLRQDGEQTDGPEGQHSRQKRKLDSVELVELWTLPVRYKYNGEHTAHERSEIERAMRHWSEHTCVSFEEIPTHQTYTDNHLLFTRDMTSCYTYVGKTNTIPQQINLMPACFSQFGVLIHEIGHILGFWHEQQRSDRDDFISVNFENLGSYYMQFRKLSTENLDVGYDMGSVMHYAPYDGTKNGQQVIQSVDRLYQSNMGQRTGLSFNDAKIINFAYCSDVCTSPLPRPCEKGGYQDPNDCSKCQCSPGYGGTYCDQLQASNANCGGEVVLNTTGEHFISSPNYPEAYTSFTSCNWRVKAPAGHKVMFKFDGTFKVFSQSQKQCFHWVEVKYKGQLDKQGPRFCGDWKPYYRLESEHDEMLIIFRSDFHTTDQEKYTGFKIKLWTIPNPDATTVTVKPSTESTPSTTTQSTSTQSTTTQSTTTQSTETTSSSTSTTTATVPISTTVSTTISSTTKDSTSSTTSTQPSKTTALTGTDDDHCIKVDLSFLLDSSGSVGPLNWETSKDFVSEIIQRLTISSHCTRVAVLSFGNMANTYVSLSDYTEGESSLLSTIDSMKFKNQWTNTADALRVLVDDVYTETNGDRRNVKDVSVLLTDGEGNVKPETTLPNAKKVRDQGIVILGIGVGSKVNKPELSAVTNNSDHVNFVNTFSDLVNNIFLDNMIKTIKAISTATNTQPTSKTSTTQSSTTESSTTQSSTTESSTTESSTTQPSTTQPSTTQSSTTQSSTTQSSTTQSSTTESSTTESSTSSLATNSPLQTTNTGFHCSFEEDETKNSAGSQPTMCDLIQRQDDQFDWTLHSGPTPSEPTGPVKAFNGEYYVFIEASKPRKLGDSAVLQLPAVSKSRQYCLTFNYHMFGFHVNTLIVSIETSDGSSRRLVWSRVGQQGDQWLEAEIEETIYKGEKVQFEGICGKEYSGDIALDNIHLTGC